MSTMQHNPKKNTAATGNVNATNLAPLFATDYHVYINHTDAGGIVYHANHLVFFENCRRDWFTQLGLNGYFLQTDDGQVQHFVVSQAQLHYRKAILLDDTISVRVDRVELKPASIIFHQSIHRRAPTDERTVSQDALAQDILAKDTLLSSGKVVIACVQNQVKSDNAASAAPIRPIRVPQKLYDSIQRAITQQAATQNLS